MIWTSFHTGSMFTAVVTYSHYMQVLFALTVGSIFIHIYLVICGLR